MSKRPRQNKTALIAPVSHFTTRACVLSILLSILCLVSAWRNRADGSEDAGSVAPPIAGQPINFSGAVGRYSVSMRAAPTELQAEERVSLTVRISVTGRGALDQIKRPDLRKLPQFSRQFEIENGREQDLAKEKTRAFEYSLRPRSQTVKQIPALPFVYFNPDILPSTRGYQTAYAAAIPLTVKARAAVTDAQVQGSAPLPVPPEAVLHISSGLGILQHEKLFQLPGWGTLIFLAVVPPLLCFFLLGVWRRMHPDTARLVRQRRSQAARAALRALDALEKVPARAQALRVKDVLVDYLRERFEFTILEPTPLEVASFLCLKGLPQESAAKAGQVFAACDTARFAPECPGAGESTTASAARLVHSLEEASWPAQAA